MSTTVVSTALATGLWARRPLTFRSRAGSRIRAADVADSGSRGLVGCALSTVLRLYLACTVARRVAMRLNRGALSTLPERRQQPQCRQS